MSRQHPQSTVWTESHGRKPGAGVNGVGQQQQEGETVPESQEEATSNGPGPLAGGKV